MHKAKVDKSKPQTGVTTPAAAPPEEQIPGQTDIENDFPELVPETMKKHERESTPKTANPHKSLMRGLVGELSESIENELWGTALVKVHDLKNMLEQAAGEGQHE